MARNPYFRCTGYDGHQYISHYECCSCRGRFVELPQAKFCPHCGIAFTHRSEWDTDEDKQSNRFETAYRPDPQYTVESRGTLFGQQRSWMQLETYFPDRHRMHQREVALAVLRKELDDNHFLYERLDVRILKDGKQVFIQSKTSS